MVSELWPRRSGFCMVPLTRLGVHCTASIWIRAFRLNCSTPVRSYRWRCYWRVWGFISSPHSNRSTTRSPSKNWFDYGQPFIFTSSVPSSPLSREAEQARGRVNPLLAGTTRSVGESESRMYLLYTHLTEFFNDVLQLQYVDILSAYLLCNITHKWVTSACIPILVVLVVL